jgi:hypothetical protein
MPRYQILFKEKGVIEAKYHHPDSMDLVEYNYLITVKDGGKLPIQMKFKGIDVTPSFAPEMPNSHTINAVDLISLYVKLEKWFSKYGYIALPPVT